MDTPLARLDAASGAGEARYASMSSIGGLSSVGGLSGGPSPEVRKAKKGLFRGRSFRKSRSKARAAEDIIEVRVEVSWF